MLYDKHGKVNEVKHWFELFADTTQPVQSTVPHATPKTSDFERVKLVKMLI